MCLVSCLCIIDHNKLHHKCTSHCTTHVYDTKYIVRSHRHQNGGTNNKPTHPYSTACLYIHNRRRSDQTKDHWSSENQCQLPHEIRNGLLVCSLRAISADIAANGGAKLAQITVQMRHSLGVHAPLNLHTTANTQCSSCSLRRFSPASYSRGE